MVQTAKLRTIVNIPRETTFVFQQKLGSVEASAVLPSGSPEPVAPGTIRIKRLVSVFNMGPIRVRSIKKNTFGFVRISRIMDGLAGHHRNDF